MFMVSHFFLCWCKNGTNAVRANTLRPRFVFFPHPRTGLKRNDSPFFICMISDSNRPVSTYLSSPIDSGNAPVLTPAKSESLLLTRCFLLRLRATPQSTHIHKHSCQITFAYKYKHWQKSLNRAHPLKRRQPRHGLSLHGPPTQYRAPLQVGGRRFAKQALESPGRPSRGHALILEKS